MNNTYLISNEDSQIAVNLICNGDFVVPDDSLYSYKIMKNSGEVVYSEDALEVPEDHKDWVSIPISADQNILPEGVLFEDRYIVILFTYKGNTVRLKTPYRLIEEPYFTASVKDVRNIFGINDGELSDDELDMTEVYLTMYGNLGEEFAEALKSGNKSNFRANRAIAIQAALNIFNSLRLRVAESEKSGTNTFLRNLKIVDWDALKNDLEEELSGILEDITGESELYVDNYTPFSLGARSPDAVTGEES